jgi:hypothetical protein
MTMRRRDAAARVSRHKLIGWPGKSEGVASSYKDLQAVSRSYFPELIGRIRRRLNDIGALGDQPTKPEVGSSNLSGRANQFK